MPNNRDFLNREIRDGYVLINGYGRGYIQIVIIVNVDKHKRICMYGQNDDGNPYVSDPSRYYYSNRMCIIIEEDLPKRVLDRIKEIQQRVLEGYYK